MKKLILLIVLLAGKLALFSQIPTANLVGYWPFSGNANDYSGNSNHGTVFGATLTQDRFGNPNSAYSFDGISNKIVVNNSSTIDMATNTTNFTISFWEKTSSIPNQDASMVCKSTYGVQSGYSFFSNSTNSGYCNYPGELSFYVAAGVSGDACSNSAVASGSNSANWYFIVGVFDGSLNTAKLYINGVLQSDIGSRNGNLTTATSLNFGSHPANLAYFKGTLDDIRIYKTLLTTAEINALYAECSGTLSPAVNTTPPANTTICSGNTTTLSGTGGTLLNWYASSTSTTALITSSVFVTSTLTPGIYTYYLENASCTSTAPLVRVPVTVTVSSTPTIVAGNGTICAGQSFSISPSGATNFVISGGNNYVSPPSTTIYTITGSNGGCSAVETITVFVNPIPAITIQSGTICPGQTFSLSPSGASTYAVTGGNLVVSPSATSLYTVTGTSSFGCVSPPVVSTVQVSSGQIFGFINAAICMGQSYTLSPSGALTYTFPGGSAVVSPSATTSYTVLGNFGSGCSSTSVFNIAVNPLPNIFINGTNFVCQGSSFSWLATGALTYSWNTGINSSVASFTPLATTAYVVTGTDVNGCSVSASKTITVNPLPLITASANNPVICSGSPAILNGGGAITYLWSGGITNGIIFYPSVTSTYTVTGTDQNGCVSSTAIKLTVVPMPVINITATSQTICAGDEITLTVTGAIQYNWNNGFTGAQIIVNPNTTTSYTVTGIDANNCSSKAVYTQNVTNCLSINNFKMGNAKLSLYPNPSQGKFIVESSEPMAMKIINAIGQIVINGYLIEGRNEIDLERNSNGIYMLYFSNKNSTKIIKVVKE